MGVSRETVRPGKAGCKPKMGDRVTMHYVCRLASSGKIVDSSKIKGRAAEFQIGTGRVIRGWDEGVMEMDEGEEAILKVRCLPRPLLGPP
jgi:FKBP-type peptidyl-prolyl cis-trans isomerase